MSGAGVGISQREIAIAEPDVTMTFEPRDQRARRPTVAVGLLRGREDAAALHIVFQAMMDEDDGVAFRASPSTSAPGDASAASSRAATEP